MSTGIANSGAALGEGLNAGAQFGSSVIDSARKRQQYQADQASRSAAGASADDTANSGPAAAPDPGSADAAQNTAAHTNFLQSLGQGLSHIGTGINNFFAGAPPAGANPGAAPAAGLPPQPGMQAPPAAAAAPPPAPVGLPQAPGAPTAGVAGGATAYMSEGGPVPNSGAALGTGLNAGAQFGDSVIAASREREQHGLDQASRSAAGDAVDDIANHPVEQFAQHLHDAALDDQNIPNGQAASTVGLPAAPPGAAGDAAPAGAPVAPSPPPGGAAPPPAAGAPTPTPGAPSAGGQPAPAPNPAQVQGAQLLASVAKNPAAQQGLPEKGATDADPNVSGSGGATAAHSITPEWWDHSDQLMAHAAAQAARAGHDPDAVYQSLNHMRTSFVQGHMLRAASAASVALQNGDMQGVEQNLRNMNYYLPDGKDLNVQKQGGQLVYQNPLQQFVDPTGQPTNAAKDPVSGKPNQPNMIPVDQAHIQLLGQAILDPMKVNDTLMATRAAAANQALEAAKTQSQVTDSTAKLMDAQTKAKTVATTNVLNLSKGQYYQARAAAASFAAQRLKFLQQNQKLDPGLLKGAQSAGSIVSDTLLGPKTSVPVTDADGNPSLSPAAGKTVHDPSKIDPRLKDVTAMEAAQVQSNAQDLFIANAKKGMSAAHAAQIALQVRMAKNQNHPGPDKKPQPNAYVHEEQGEVGVWDPQIKQYRTYSILPGSADSMLGGQQTEEQYTRILSSAANGGGNDENDNGDNTPAQ